MELNISLDTDSQQTLIRLCEQYQQNPSEVLKTLLMQTEVRQYAPKTWEVESNRQLWIEISHQYVKGLTEMCNNFKIDDLEKAVGIAIREYLDNR